MTTARDVIADETVEAFRQALRKIGVDLWGISSYEFKDAISAALLSAPESVRLELAAKLNPWRPIETAPKDGTWILVPYPHFLRDDTFDGFEIMIVKWKGVGWDTGAWMLHRDPQHWLPLPAPPSEDKPK